MRALVVFLLLASNIALADDAGLLRCRAIRDSAARLACYDALEVPSVPQAQPASRAGAQPVPAQPAAQPAAQAPEQFGLEHRKQAATLDAIESTIPGAFEGWRPKSNIRLANGQVWQVADDSSGVVYGSNPKVRVRRGALGAFYLEIEGTNRSPRVVRLQ
jgi:hypothetical protein